MRVTREPVLLDGNSTGCGCSGFSPGPAKRCFPADKSLFFLFSRGQGFGGEADERDEGSDRGQVQRPVDLIHAGLVVFVAVVVFLQKHAKRASLLNNNLILLF